MTGPRHVDLLAVAGAVLAVVMAVVYVAVIRQQDEAPGAVVLVVLMALLGAAAAAGYGARTSSAHRVGVLLTASVLLGGLGVLALLSIGLPIIVAGGLCLAAAIRARVDEPLSFPPRSPSPGQEP